MMYKSTGMSVPVINIPEFENILLQFTKASPKRELRNNAKTHAARDGYCEVVKPPKPVYKTHLTLST